MKCLTTVLALLILCSASTWAQKMKYVMGSHTRLLLSTKDLLTSMAWWTRMGFSPVTMSGEKIDSAITLSDGQVVLTLVKTSMPSPVIVYRTENIKRVKQLLDSLVIPMTYEVEGPMYSELRITSPNNVHVAIRASSVEPPIRATGALNTLCGKKAEYSTAAVRLGVEVQWWADIGFTPAKTDSSFYPFMNMTDGTIEVGIHENKDIPSLAITYFMDDMEERIDRLKKAGVTPIEELPTVDNRLANAIFRSPEGQLVFLFETVKK